MATTAMHLLSTTILLVLAAESKRNIEFTPEVVEFLKQVEGDWKGEPIEDFGDDFAPFFQFYARSSDTVFSIINYQKNVNMWAFDSFSSKEKQMQLVCHFGGETSYATIELDGEKLVFRGENGVSIFTRGRLPKTEPMRRNIDYSDMRVLALIQQFEGDWVCERAVVEGEVWKQEVVESYPILRIDEDSVVPLNGDDHFGVMVGADIEKQRIRIGIRGTLGEISYYIIALKGRKMVVVSMIDDPTKTPTILEPTEDNEHFTFVRRGKR